MSSFDLILGLQFIQSRTLKRLTIIDLDGLQDIKSINEVNMDELEDYHCGEVPDCNYLSLVIEARIYLYSQPVDFLKLRKC